MKRKPARPPSQRHKKQPRRFSDDDEDIDEEIGQPADRNTGPGVASALPSRQVRSHPTR